MSSYYINRRKQRRMAIVKDILAMAIFAVAIGIGTIALVNHQSQKDYYYYTAQGEMVDKPCEIVAINGDVITVQTVNGGERYDFYGDSVGEIGDTIICTFTVGRNELVDVQ